MTRARRKVVGGMVSGMVAVTLSGMASEGAAAPLAVVEQASPAGPGGQSAQTTSRRPYRATRRIVVDRQSKQARMPTQAEVESLVATLATLTHRPGTAPESAGTRGAVTVNLQGGFGGVMLARANEDGTVETRCVFTFDEGAEFLGLVEVVQ